MDTLKEAFNKIKQDIDSLNKRFDFLSKNLINTKDDLVNICDILKELNLVNKKLEKQNSFFFQNNLANNSNLEFIYSLLKRLEEKEDFLLKELSLLKQNGLSSIPTYDPTHNVQFSSIPTYDPTHNCNFKPQNGQNTSISIGNEGVPTDRQTNQQTNQQTGFNVKNGFLKDFINIETLKESSYNKEENYIQNATEVLNSLDAIKKEVRLKFKRLTEQEITVFSAIYQLDEEKGYSDYKMLSIKLNLTESSIRDYVGRLLKKGIPIDKIKLNNKQIQLKISENLKKIATLNTILSLREL